MNDIDLFRAGEYNSNFTDTGVNLAIHGILQKFLSDPRKNKLNSIYANGFVSHADEFSILEKQLIEHGGVIIYQATNYDIYLMCDESLVYFNRDKKSLGLTIKCWTCDDELKKLVTEYKETYIAKNKKGLVFSIVQNGSNLNIANVGSAPSPRISDNYHPEVIADIDYVTSVFNKENPSGRICILSGEPGTGKTHLIRSLLDEIKALFLIVPSNLISSLDSPGFLPLLIEAKNNWEQPIVLVIEDGDACLVPRKSDNISTIASLLNLSDGILGSIIDIRIIISTNAEIREIDQAIKRPGRLCKQIHVGTLPWEQANKVYQRLTGDDKAKLMKSIRHYTLAEVYQIANSEPEAKLTLSSPQKKVIGFNTSHSQQDLTINKLTE